MISTAQHLGDRSERVEYSFIEALSLGPHESLSLVSKEQLGLDHEDAAPPPPLKKSLTTSAANSATVRPVTPHGGPRPLPKYNHIPAPLNLKAAAVAANKSATATSTTNPALVTPVHSGGFSQDSHNTHNTNNSLSPPGSSGSPDTIRNSPHNRPAAAAATLASPPTLHGKKSNTNMANSVKAQAQCLEVCHKTTALGDRVSVRMLEYLTTVTKQPHGLDTLAHDFLDTCEILFSIEAGLGECVRTGQSFPGDVISELSKKFRVTQADFQLLDQLLAKFLDHERRGAMGRMRRGWGKIFGDNDIEKMIAALGRTRESLRMSALMFQWSLGHEKIEREMGIGFTGLAAALDRMDSRAGVARPKASDALSHYRPSSSSQHRGIEGHSMGHGSTLSSVGQAPHSALQPPLPPLPWAERSSSMNPPEPLSPAHAPHDYTTRHHSGISGHSGVSGQHTASSVGSGNDRYHSGTTATFDRLSTFDEAVETRSQAASALSDADVNLEEIAGIDPSARAVRLKADPAGMPRWVPRNTAGSDAANLKSALLSAVRGKNHKLVEQLLDRGVSPNTGADLMALREAVMSCDAETVRLLLLFGADPNAVDRDGSTALFAAVEKNFVAGAVQLLKYGASPDMAPGPDHHSPLAGAAAAGKINFTHLLLIYGGDVAQLNANGDTLLISCINKKTPKRFADLLLEYGADPDAKSREGKTALFEAIQNARVDIVSALLEAGANPNLPGPKHMLWPATYQTPCLQVLLKHGADPKKAPGIMELAASVNNVESIRTLLKAGVDPNAKKDGVYTPLCTSIRDNRPDIFELLLSNGADPNTPASEYPAFKCVTHNRLQFLPRLVSAGASLTSPKGIVETAVSVNNMEALGWLLDQGLNPNEKSPKGYSPLTTSIRENRLEMVDMLLSRGADPNVRGQDWPLCMAVKRPAILKRILAVLAEPRAFKGVMEMAVVANQLESVKLLLAAGVSVEDKNGGVFSPLTSAIREERKDIVHFLVLEGGADINAPGEHLPVVKALRRYRGDAEILEFLLDNGADPNKVYRGWNGVMQAVENGDDKILRLLGEKSGFDLGVRDELGRNVCDIAASRGWEEGVAILNDASLKR